MRVGGDHVEQVGRGVLDVDARVVVVRVIRGVRHAGGDPRDRVVEAQTFAGDDGVATDEAEETVEVSDDGVNRESAERGEEGGCGFHFG